MKKSNRILLFLLALLSFSGCSAIRHMTAMFRSTDQFIPHEIDSRLRYESQQAYDFADLILPFVSRSISTVKTGHYKSFISPVEIFKWHLIMHLKIV